MNKLVNKFVNKIQIWKKPVILTFILIMLYFGINAYLNFATDSYAFVNGNLSESALDMATRNGRPVVGLIYGLYNLSGLPNIGFYYVSSVLAFVILGAAILIYRSILAKHGIGEYASVIIAFAAIANIYIIEYFMFIEKCCFMLTILFDVAGVYFIEKFLEGKKAGHFVLALAAITFAIFTYQGTIALFVILSLPFALKHAEGLKDYIVNVAAVGIVYAVPVAVDVLAFKFIFKSARVTDGAGLMANFRSALSDMLSYSIGTFGLFPRYLYMVLTAACVLCLILVIAAGKKKVLTGVLNIAAIIIAAYILSTASIIQGSGWWALRVVYPLASLLGALLVNLYVNYRETLRKQGVVSRAGRVIAVLVVGIVLVQQYVSFNKLYIDRYSLNALDKERYNYIAGAIRDYEKESGEDITKVAFYRDSHTSSPTYSGLYATGDFTISAFNTDWSDINAMNFYLGTDYEKIDPANDYAAYFAGRDWKRFSADQLVFDGDTLHLCVY